MDINATTLNRIVNQAARKDYRKFTDIVGTRAHEVIQAINNLENPSAEDIRAIDQDVWDHNLELVKARVARKTSERRDQYERAAANRALYLPSFTLEIAAKISDGTPYWRFSSDLESPGLGVMILRDQGIDVGNPIALQLSNELPFEEDMNGRPTARRHSIHSQEFGFLREEGYRVSKESVVWHWPSVENLMCRVFPKAVDFTAYNHRLRAPLLPGGFMKNETISCVTLMTSDAPAGYQVPTDEEAKLLNTSEPVRTIAGVDGSGVYDPDHPQMADLISRYGKVVFQLSVVCPVTGMFAKGIIVPREGACQEYGVDTGIILDHGQIKGACKDVHKEALGTDRVITYNNVYVGVMKAWDRPGTMGAGFEQLENIRMQEPVYVVVEVKSKDLRKVTEPWRITIPLLTRLGINNPEQVFRRLEQRDLLDVRKLTPSMRLRARSSKTERYGVVPSVAYCTAYVKDGQLVESRAPMHVQKLQYVAKSFLQAEGPEWQVGESMAMLNVTLATGVLRNVTLVERKQVADPVISKLLDYRDNMPKSRRLEVREGSVVECYAYGQKFHSEVITTIVSGERKFMLLRPQGFDLRSRANVHVRLPGGLKVGNGIRATAAMLKSLTREYLDRLMKGGVDKLIGQVAAEDPNAKLIVDFATVAKAHGVDFNLMSIDMIRSAVEDRKQRRLWIAAQGAGIEGDQLVIVMDNNVRPGHIVTRRVKVGQECAAWRFPTILACGLLTLVGQEPLRHHLVDGEVPPNTAYMNPADVLKMQGDDDGDIIACTTDRRVVALWKEREDDNYYAIEPAGEKLDYGTNSDEGWVYGQRDPMGPVGILTILRSMLLAVGDKWGALAMSVMIQEAIDSAKRKVRWTNWELAADIRNWHQVGPGHFAIHVKGKTQNYLDREIEVDELLDEIFAWADMRMNAHGCMRTSKVRQYPIAWKIQHRRVEDNTGYRLVPVKKRVVVATWKPCKAKSNGYEGGNWVHAVHDWAYEMWSQYEASFMGDEINTKLNELLPTVLGSVGEYVAPQELLPEQYDALCERVGLNRFGKDMKRIMSANHDDSDRRNREIAQATAALHNALHKNASLQDLVNIWHWETTPRWRYRMHNRDEWRVTSNYSEVQNLKIPDHCGPYQINKPQRAFRAITHPGSPIMGILGIKPEKVCDFLTAPTPKGNIRGELIVHRLMNPTDEERKYSVYERLAATVYHDRTHEKVKVTPDGVGIQMHECQYCRDTLQTGLVRAIRDGRQLEETESMRNLITAMRMKPRNWKPEFVAKQFHDEVQDYMNERDYYDLNQYE